jgi:hypothetical protein
VLNRLLGDENGTKYVDVEFAMELILGDLFQRLEPGDAGIVDHHVDGAKRLFGLRKQSPHVDGAGDVALYRNGSATPCFDISDNAVRTVLAGGVIHHHRGARRAQALGDGRADAS